MVASWVVPAMSVKGEVRSGGHANRVRSRTSAPADGATTTAATSTDTTTSAARRAYSPRR